MSQEKEPPLVDRFPEGLPRIACVSCAAVNGQPVHGQRFARLYDVSTVTYWRTRYEPSLRWNLDRMVLPTLTQDELKAVHGVSLRIPLRHEDDPFAYFVSGAPPAITISVSSIKFLDDLSIALAWLDRHRFSIEVIPWYASVLKYRDSSEFPGGRYPLPLDALAIPDDALADAAVDQLAQKLLKSAVLFMLAHEIGHIIHRHRGNGPGVPRADWQENELAADRFAMRFFREVGIAPVGIVPFFLAAAHLVPHRADFESDCLWTEYLDARAAHPFTGHRVRTLANELRRTPAEFTHREPNRGTAAQRVHIAADQIEGVAPLLDDPDLQRYTAEVGRRIPLSELARRRRA
jgi:hypothetical protein